MNSKETNRLDKLWAEIVRKRGKCEYPGCNKTEYLNAHHIYSRSKRSTRWDINNSLLLCPLHHTLGDRAAHKDPDFKDIIIENGVRTRELYEDLGRKAFTPQKIDYKQTLEYLTNELKKLK
jgi:predicted restriction endonuclease